MCQPRLLKMLVLLQVFVMLHCVNSVRITKMRVPEVLQHGSKEAVILDCDYVTKNVTGLVVKWFFNDKSQPVYQWIPPQKPQALGVLKNKLDLTYKVSPNPYAQHRALRILDPEPQLTGNYTCVISTFLSEDQRTRPMTIFDELPNEALATAHVLGKIDALFDAMNANSKDKQNGKPYLTNMTSKSPHLQLFAEMKLFFNNMKFIGARSQPPSLNGWVRSINAFEKLFQILIFMYATLCY